jgi:hypothetical protein
VPLYSYCAYASFNLGGADWRDLEVRKSARVMVGASGPWPR